jgi:hypothetical protein
VKKLLEILLDSEQMGNQIEKVETLDLLLAGHCSFYGFVAASVGAAEPLHEEPEGRL